MIIQTRNPNHWIIQKVIANDYEAMYHQELLERKNFNYPPFYRLIQLTVKHRDKNLTEEGARELVKLLQVELKGWVLGPEFPSIARIRNFYLMNVLIKFDRKASPTKIKRYINDSIGKLKQNKTFKSCIVKVDIDPI